jgi:acetate kinase
VRVLVVNAGSSSLKLRLLDRDDAVMAATDLAVRRGGVDGTAVRDWVRRLPASVDAVGHRVVHGGQRFVHAVRVDAQVEAELWALTDLAPLHQPKSLAAMDLVGSLLPEPPVVASFDTAFHATLPAAAATYPIPAEWRQRFAVRRYGFHGLSHAYASRRAARLLGRSTEGLRLVTCHLGAGASLAAVRDGRSVDTTMGFTPLDGLVMATRSGSLDPGLVLWLQEHAGISADELADNLENSSGLTALAGTPDMRHVLERRAAGDEMAELAFEVYVHRLRAGIAAMAAALEGLDAVVFTGGVGEKAAAVRAASADGLGFLGLSIDAGRNEAVQPDADISSPQAAVRMLVVAAREDVQIAEEARGVLAV